MKKYFILLFILLFTGIYASDKNDYYSIIDKTYKDKTYSEGIKSLEKAIKEYPDEANFHSNLIFMYCHSNRFGDAVKHGSYVINRFPDSKYIQDSYRWGLVGLGWEEFNRKDFTSALKTFTTSYKMFPEDKDVLNGYGCALRELKKYDEAVVVLKKGYDKFPDDQYLKGNLSWSYFYLADVMAKKGDDAKGRVLLKKYFDLADKNDANIWANYFYKCNDLKVYNEGIALLPEAVKKFPANDEVYKAGFWLYWNRADSCKTSGDYQNMVSDLKDLCRYSSSKDLIHESGLSFYHMAVSIAHIDVFETIEKICPYWKKFSGNEKKQSYALLEQLKKDIPPEFKFIEHNLTGMILYREDRVAESYSELEAGYNEALKLPFAEKFKYNEPVYIPVPLKGFIDSSNVESRKYITHMGLNGNCYDLMGADENGGQVKNGVDPYKSKASDWYGFGIKVYSPVDGVVYDSENINSDDTPYPKVMKRGNFIQIKTADGSIFHFYHLKKGSVKFRKGDMVKKGDVIAELGNSASTTPHLHFGVYSSDWIVSRPVFFINYTSIKDGNRSFVESGRPGLKNESYELIEVK